MKTIYLWIVGAIIVIIAGIWLVRPSNPAQPESSASPTVSETPTDTSSPETTGTIMTPTPSKTPVNTATHTPAPSATPAPAMVYPTISSVTVTAPTQDVSSWTAVMSGGLPSAPSGQCYQIAPPSFYIEGNTYYVTLKANLTPSSTTCMYGFTQTIQLGETSTTPGLHSIYVNETSWTSYIVSEPTPTGTP